MELAYKYIRYLAYIIEITVFYIIEQVPDFIPAINGTRPILVLPVVFIIALFEGEKVALVFGFLTGVLLDITATGTIGFYTVVLALTAYLLGLAARYIIESVNLFNSILACIASISAVYGLHFLIMFLIKGYKEAGYVFVNHYLMGTLYTMMIVPVVYFFNRAFAVNIRRGE